MKSFNYIMLIGFLILGSISFAQDDYTAAYDASGNRTGFNVVVLKSAEISGDSSDTLSTTPEGEQEQWHQHDLDGITVKIFPNPTTGQLFIHHELSIDPGSGSEMVLYNASGVMISNGRINLPMDKIDLTGQPPGIYYLKIYTGNGKISQWKIIKQ